MNRADLYDKDFIKKFWARVQEGSAQECWPWKLNPIKRHGYAIFKFSLKGKLFYPRAHVVAYELTNGPTNGSQVHHSCDRRSCCNPAHLFLGTPKSNMDECVAKGRNRRGNYSRGEQIPWAKLRPNDVLEIRQCLKNGKTYAAVAALFSVCEGNIWKIATRRTWKHI